MIQLPRRVLPTRAIVRRVAAVVLLAMGGAAAGCGDSGPTGPVVDEAWSFEDGYEGWTLGRTAETQGNALLASGGASDGDTYFEVTLLAPAELVWVSRSFEVEPDVDYNVEIRADARTFEGRGYMAYAAADVPIGAVHFEGGDPVPGPWTPVSFTMEEYSGAGGRIHVAVGVGSSIDGAGRFGRDRVQVRITRK